jgi:hypothetical protein
VKLLNNPTTPPAIAATTNCAEFASNRNAARCLPDPVGAISTSGYARDQKAREIGWLGGSTAAKTHPENSDGFLTILCNKVDLLGNFDGHWSRF